MNKTKQLICPKCGGNKWINIDNPTEYVRVCANKEDCYYTVVIKKSDFLNNFQCPKCNCLNGELEENDKFIAIRCKHCGEQIIMLEKQTDLNNRNDPIIIAQQSGKPICPRCGSTSISTGSRGWKWTTGFIGSGKTVNRCANCGHMWEPGK